MRPEPMHRFRHVAYYIYSTADRRDAELDLGFIRQTTVSPNLRQAFLDYRDLSTDRLYSTPVRHCLDAVGTLPDVA
jgi:hypothetical protein